MGLLFFAGTYRAEDTMCYQTGLPLDKFSIVSTNYHYYVLLLL